MPVTANSFFMTAGVLPVLTGRMVPAAVFGKAELFFLMNRYLILNEPVFNLE